MGAFSNPRLACRTSSPSRNSGSKAVRRRRLPPGPGRRSRSARRDHRVRTARRGGPARDFAPGRPWVTGLRSRSPSGGDRRRRHRGHDRFPLIGSTCHVVPRRCVGARGHRGVYGLRLPRRLREIAARRPGQSLAPRRAAAARVGDLRAGIVPVRGLLFTAGRWTDGAGRLSGVEVLQEGLRARQRSGYGRFRSAVRRSSTRPTWTRKQRLKGATPAMESVDGPWKRPPRTSAGRH